MGKTKQKNKEFTKNKHKKPVKKDKSQKHKSSKWDNQ